VWLSVNSGAIPGFMSDGSVSTTLGLGRVSTVDATTRGPGTPLRAASSASLFAVASASTADVATEEGPARGDDEAEGHRVGLGAAAAARFRRRVRAVLDAGCGPVERGAMLTRLPRLRLRGDSAAERGSSRRGTRHDRPRTRASAISTSTVNSGRPQHPRDRHERRRRRHRLRAYSRKIPDAEMF
jgi:hypothetical protein